MSQLVTRSASLVPRRSSPESTGFALSYSFDGEAVGHLELGNLLVVAEVGTKPKNGEALCDLIIQTVGDQYYNRNQEVSPMERFEAAVKTLNSELKTYQDQDNSWVGKLHVAIAVLAADGMHVSSTGDARALLVRRGQSLPITAESGGSADDKFFPSVSSGQLKAGDKLLIATAELIAAVDNQKLTSIMTASNPNRAAQEIAKLIGKGPTSTKTAAVVAEVITAQAMSMMPMPDEPATAVAGPIPTWLDKTKRVTGPAAIKVANGLKKGTTKAASATKQHLLPRLRQASLKIVGWIRTSIAGRRNKPKLWAAVAAIVMVAIVIVLQISANQAAAKLSQRFDAALANFIAATDALGSDNKDLAKTKTLLAKTQVDSLAKSKDAAKLEKILKAKAHPEGQPGTLAELKEAVLNLSDSLEGLVRLTPVIVADFATASAAKPIRLEQIGDKIIAVDGSAVYQVDTNGQIKRVATAQLGTILATTATSEGLYILTSEPMVWQFKLAEGSLEKIAVTIGDWPRGKSISAYGGNLYILTDDQVYKHVPTIGGFAPKTDYLAAADASQAKNATAIAVDGSVYLGGGEKILVRFFAGNLVQTATGIPSSLIAPTSMRADGTQIILASSKTDRFGLVGTSEDSLALIRQFVFKDQTGLVDAVYDVNNKTVYAIAGNKLIKSQISF